VYDSGKVPSSNSGKESSTVSGKHPGKKLGKELPDQVKTRVRWPDKKKNVRQGDFFASGKRPFCTWEHQIYTRPIQHGDKVESESNKEGQSKLKEEIYRSPSQGEFQDRGLDLNQDRVG
jgi:hypothetical protein